MNKFYDLKIFHPMVMGGEYEKVKEAIKNMICFILLSKLEPAHKEILEVENYFILDSNDPEQGKKMEGLLEHFVYKAISHAGTLGSSDDFISKMTLYDLEKFTGIYQPTVLMKNIEEINEKWERLATISIFGEHGSDPEITFRLLTKYELN